MAARRRKPRAAAKDVPPRTLDDLLRRVLAFRDEREWKPFHNPKDLAISVTLEAAELLEHFQWKTPAEVRAHLADPGNHEEVGDEMADILCLLLSLSDAAGVDLHEAVVRKLGKAARKYPVEKCRGSARKYTELRRRARS